MCVVIVQYCMCGDISVCEMRWYGVCSDVFVCEMRQYGVCSDI